MIHFIKMITRHVGFHHCRIIQHFTLAPFLGFQGQFYQKKPRSTRARVYIGGNMARAKAIETKPIKTEAVKTGKPVDSKPRETKPMETEGNKTRKQTGCKPIETVCQKAQYIEGRKPAGTRAQNRQEVNVIFRLDKRSGMMYG